MPCWIFLFAVAATTAASAVEGDGDVFCDAGVAMQVGFGIEDGVVIPPLISVPVVPVSVPTGFGMNGVTPEFIIKGALYSNFDFLQNNIFY